MSKITVTRDLQGAIEDLEWQLEQAQDANARTPGSVHRSPKKAAASARQQAFEVALRIVQSIQEDKA